MNESAAVVRVVAGNATPEEMAAVLAVVAARPAGARGRRTPARGRGGGPADVAASTWASRSLTHRTSPGLVLPGPDGWRTSARPR